MKKIISLLSFFSIFIVSCTFEKGEVVQPVDIKDCVKDSTIDVIAVTIGDDFFNPASITIVTGDTVKWTYTSGSSVHSTICDGLTSGTSLPSGGTSWNSDIDGPSPMVPGNTYKKAISVPGNYTYICGVHGSMMSGTIIVKPRCN
ncbi:MAG: cupredoxin domain-containing protein [Bacteroidota bacterium]